MSATQVRLMVSSTNPIPAGRFGGPVAVPSKRTARQYGVGGGASPVAVAVVPRDARVSDRCARCGWKSCQCVHAAAPSEITPPPLPAEACCRICFDATSEKGNRLVVACACRGDSKWAHEGCLQLWAAASPNSSSSYEALLRHLFSARRAFFSQRARVFFSARHAKCAEYIKRRIFFFFFSSRARAFSIKSQCPTCKTRYYGSAAVALAKQRVELYAVAVQSEDGAGVMVKLALADATYNLAVVERRRPTESFDF